MPVQVYQDDLRENPDNPWALTGLRDSYHAAAAAAPADSAAAGEMSGLASDVAARLAVAWRGADEGLSLPSSCPMFSQTD